MGFEKGNEFWKRNIGYKHTKEARKRMSLSQKRRFSGIKRFDGDLKFYHRLHLFIRDFYGKAYKCENCNTAKNSKFEWACINGRYLNLERSEWRMLCAKCHRNYDYDGKSLNCLNQNENVFRYKKHKVSLG